MKIDAFAEKLSHLSQLNQLQVEETASYGEVVKLMRENRIGSVLVCRRGRIRGIFTERDVLNKCLLEKVPASTPVSKLMTPDPVTVKPQTTVSQAIAAMHKNHVRNLPIVDEQGRPLGLLTVGRIIRYIADHFPAEVVNLPPQPSQISQEIEGA